MPRTWTYHELLSTRRRFNDMNYSNVLLSLCSGSLKAFRAAWDWVLCCESKPQPCPARPQPAQRSLLISLWCSQTWQHGRSPWKMSLCHIWTFPAPRWGCGTPSFTFHFIVTAAKLKQAFKSSVPFQWHFQKFCRRGWFQDATLEPCGLVFSFLEITGCWLRTSSRKRD